MRVLVAEASTLRLRADGRQRLELSGLGGEPLQLSRLLIKSSHGQWLIESPELGRRSLPRTARLTIHSRDPRGIWLGQRRYSGELRLVSREGRIQVVNHLGIESYLASVVGSEMPQDWPMAALQAQAVAARTYALRQRGRNGSFDLKATVASQVYQGLESATPRTREAVDSTRSLVMVHGGKLISAVFHSSSGGATEPSGEVWRNQLPYLVSVRDHDQNSPVHRWEQRFDTRQLKKAFRETGGLQRLEVLQTSSTGRLRAVRVRGPRGALEITGRELRQRLGLKSTMVSFNWLAQAPVAAVPATSHLPSTAAAVPAPTTSRMRDRAVLIGVWRDSATGSVDVESKGPASLPATSSAARPGVMPPPPPPLELSPLVTRGGGTKRVLAVRGRGFGHGVGMSQWGARGLAEQGADFRQILQHYYRGVTIRPFLPADDPAMAWIAPLRPAWSS